MNCNKEECPICYEKIDDKEPYFECSQCKKKIGLNCILQSCIRYWDNNENCKCPYCRGELTFSQEDYLIDIEAITNQIEYNNRDINRLQNIRQENISKAIQNEMGMMNDNIDIFSIEDKPTLQKIIELKNINEYLNRILSTRTKRKRSDSDWENPLRGGIYKKKTTKKNRKTNKKTNRKKFNRTNKTNKLKKFKK